jgi:hypothetical protein
VNDLLLLSSLLVVPGLLALLVLMDWLERTFAHRQVADEIAQLLEGDIDVERLEAGIAQLAQPLFPAS